MNIPKIIRNAKYEMIGRTIMMTFKFPHQEIDFFALNGRPVYRTIDKVQVSYGCNKKEAQARARQVLMIEDHEQRHLFVRCRTNPNLTDGMGVFIG